MTKGKLIVFEGVSGTGKETQARLLQRYLQTKHIQSLIVFHPTPQLKEILSSWRNSRHIDATTEVYLLLADRYDRVRQVITPTLAKGQWVISLRNAISAEVYQGTTTQMREWVRKEFSRFEPMPYKLFHFTITPEQALKRIMKRYKETGETIGHFENPKALEAKSRAYRNVLRDIPHISIDAAEDIPTIHKKIISSLF